MRRWRASGTDHETGNRVTITLAGVIRRAQPAGWPRRSGRVRVSPVRSVRRCAGARPEDWSDVRITLGQFLVVLGLFAFDWGIAFGIPFFVNAPPDPALVGGSGVRDDIFQ